MPQFSSANLSSDCQVPRQVRRSFTEWKMHLLLGKHENVPGQSKHTHTQICWSFSSLTETHAHNPKTFHCETIHSTIRRRRSSAEKINFALEHWNGDKGEAKDIQPIKLCSFLHGFIECLLIKSGECCKKSHQSRPKVSFVFVCAEIDHCGRSNLKN